MVAVPLVAAELPGRAFVDVEDAPAVTAAFAVALDVKTLESAVEIQIVARNYILLRHCGKELLNYGVVTHKGARHFDYSFLTLLRPICERKMGRRPQKTLFKAR
jgi:hypothetical protein